MPFALNSSRGVTNAMGLSGLLIGLVDADTLEGRPDNLPLLQVPGNTSGGGDTKMPAWWNASHRPHRVGGRASPWRRDVVASRHVPGPPTTKSANFPFF